MNGSIKLSKRRERGKMKAVSELILVVAVGFFQVLFIISAIIEIVK